MTRWHTATPIQINGLDLTPTHSRAGFGRQTGQQVARVFPAEARVWPFGRGNFGLFGNRRLFVPRVASPRAASMQNKLFLSLAVLRRVFSAHTSAEKVETFAQRSLTPITLRGMSHFTAPAHPRTDSMGRSTRDAGKSRQVRTIRISRIAGASGTSRPGPRTAAVHCRSKSTHSTRLSALSKVL
jgi:hypothetical protein